jgi:hypothetical protein
MPTACTILSLSLANIVDTQSAFRNKAGTPQAAMLSEAAGDITVLDKMMQPNKHAARAHAVNCIGPLHEWVQCAASKNSTWVGGSGASLPI